MATHLRRHHNIIVEKPLSKNQEAVNQQLKQYYHKAEVSGDTTELDTKILKKHLFQEVIIEALVTLIIV